LEQLILADESKHHGEMEELVAQKINLNTPGITVFEAACLLRAIEHGADPSRIRRTAIFEAINQYARWNGPHGKWAGPRGPGDFLEEFISTHAHGWDWRSDAQQGEIEDRNYKRENERIAKEIAEDARRGMAHATRFYTPDAPDAPLLSALAWESRHKKPSPEEFKLFGWSAWKHWLVICKTWPTLRELKLATAIPELELKKIMRDLRPKKAEIIKESLRHKFRRHGAMPLRYGPRLVLGVLNKLLNRLREFSIEDEEREGLRKTILSVKRAFAARLGHSRRST
jgi:hypothetical protein